MPDTTAPKDPTWLANAGQQMAGDAAGQVLGLALGGIYNQRQVKQQKRLNELNKEMIDYNYQKQLQMWKDTSYSAQMEQLSKAGLNPGLIYGMGGGGGQTGGEATTGGGATAHAGSGAGMGMQLMTAAQIDLMRAQAEKTRVEAKKLEGVDTANVVADTKLKGMRYQLDQFDLNFKTASRDDLLKQAHELARKLGGEATQAIVAGNVGTYTEDTQIKQAKADLIQTYLENKQIRADTQLSYAQMQEIAQGILESEQRVSKMAYDMWAKGIEVTQEWGRQEIMKDFNQRFEKAAWIGAGSRVISDVVNIATDFLPGGKFKKLLPNPVKGFRTSK